MFIFATYLFPSDVIRISDIIFLKPFRLLKENMHYKIKVIVIIVIIIIAITAHAFSNVGSVLMEREIRLWAKNARLSAGWNTKTWDWRTVMLPTYQGLEWDVRFCILATPALLVLLVWGHTVSSKALNHTALSGSDLKSMPLTVSRFKEACLNTSGQICHQCWGHPPCLPHFLPNSLSPLFTSPTIWKLFLSFLPLIPKPGVNFLRTETHHLF